jgi:hypothetical protein
MVVPRLRAETAKPTFCWPALRRTVPGTMATLGLLDVNVNVV